MSRRPCGQSDSCTCKNQLPAQGSTVLRARTFRFLVTHCDAIIFIKKQKIILFWAGINNYIFSLWIKLYLIFQTCFKDIISTLFPRSIRLAHMLCAFYWHIPQLSLGDIGKTFLKIPQHKWLLLLVKHLSIFFAFYIYGVWHKACKTKWEMTWRWLGRRK